MAILNNVKSLPKVGSIVTSIETDLQYGLTTIYYNDGTSVCLHVYKEHEVCDKCKRPL